MSILPKELMDKTVKKMERLENKKKLMPEDRILYFGPRDQNLYTKQNIEYIYQRAWYLDDMLEENIIERNGLFQQMLEPICNELNAQYGNHFEIFDNKIYNNFDEERICKITEHGTVIVRNEYETYFDLYDCNYKDVRVTKRKDVK